MVAVVIREALHAAVEALVPRIRWPEAGRDYHPLPPGVTTGPGVPLRPPVVEPDDEGPGDATDAERAYWAEMEARNLRAFGPGEGT